MRTTVPYPDSYKDSGAIYLLIEHHYEWVVLTKTAYLFQLANLTVIQDSKIKHSGNSVLLLIARTTHITGVDEPRHFCMRHEISVNVALQLTLAPPIVDMYNGHHVPLTAQPVHQLISTSLLYLGSNIHNGI